MLLEQPKGIYLEDFSISGDEFYQSIEQEIAARQFPELTISRENFWEGSYFVSTRRQYLRMRRERLVFDICAAPFGTSFFFSVRFAEIPVVLYNWQLLLVLCFLGGVAMSYLQVMGTYWGAVMFVMNLVALVVLLPNLVALKLHRLDDFLLQVPVFGVLYEAWFRPETYYRIDSRTMYIEMVKTIVQRRIDEVTGQQGLQLVDIDSLQPLELSNLAAAFKRFAS